nr:hypothetical protein [Neoroseomonas soli]
MVQHITQYYEIEFASTFASHHVYLRLPELHARWVTAVKPPDARAHVNAEDLCARVSGNEPFGQRSLATTNLQHV